MNLKIKSNDIVNNINKIEVFTTRPDTIFGASFVAIAPDHHLSKELAKQSTEVNDFIKAWKNHL